MGVNPKDPVRIFLVAGEASGDVLAAELIEPLRDRFGPNVVFAGVGGPALAARGIDSLIAMEQLTVLGYLEGLMAWRRIHKLAGQTAQLADAFSADIVILVDSWGFTMRVAKVLRALRPQVKLVKYVGPQVWASRPGRAKTLAKTVDHLLTIHAFDEPYYEGTGLPVTCVGNPVISRNKKGDGKFLRTAYNITQEKKVLLVLFGSRRAEFERLHEPFSQAVQRLKDTHPDLVVLCPLSHAIAVQVRAAATDDPRLQEMIFLDEAQNADAFAVADLALACSGTVTTELALAGIPMVVGYKIGGLSWFVLKTFFLKTRFASLVNVASDAMIVPEFLQADCEAGALSAALGYLLDDEARYDTQKKALADAITKMGSQGRSTAHSAAEAIHTLWQENA